MVTTKPEPTTAADVSDDQPSLEFPLVSELRLNLAALGVDGSAPDFGERLCQLSTDNEPYQFEYSANGELIIMPPTGSDRSFGENAVSGTLFSWTDENGGQNYPPTVLFRLASGAEYIPDAAWITQERFDNRTEPERRGAIVGAPDFVVEVRSRTDRLPPFLAKMQEWMDGGASLGWGIDPRNRRAYVYRAGQDAPELLEDPESLSGEDVLAGFTFAVRRLIFDRYTEEQPA